jgi:pimeloyl-ACP methyl ester carboxylesterase
MRFAAAAIAVVLVVAGGCGSDGETQPSEPPTEAAAGQGEVTLEPCGKLPKPSGFRCGSIGVPFERSDPELGETTIRFAVRPPEDGGPPRGAIFAVEGGPGYSSTGTANAFTKLFGSLLRHRELVLVDMRGTGRSEPIDCPDLQRGSGPEWITLEQCARRLGPRFESYRTAAAADDIDAVRAALGFDEITLYGDSYGTFLAQSYAFRHPDTLNALVLDSAYPARGESAWYGSLTRTGVRAIPTACERAPTCSGNAARRLEKLVDHLREDRRGVGPLLQALQDATYGAPASFVAIDRAGTALRHGNPGPWERLTRSSKPGFHHLRGYVRASELVVGCNDYPMLWDKAASEEERRVLLEEAIEAQDPDRFAPFTPREVALSSEIGYLECLTWPAPTELYEPPIEDGQEPTDAPVLVVSGEFDSLTTPYEGRLVTDMFPNGEQFVARNAGHIDALYYKDGAAARKIRSFLRANLGP